MPMWTYRDHQHAQGLHRFKLDDVPALRQGRRHGLPLLTKRLCTIDILLKEKLVFNNRVTQSILIRIKLRSHSQGKTNPKYFCKTFCLRLLCFGRFCLTGVLLVYYDVFLYLCVYVCEMEWTWVGAEDLGGVKGRESMIRICCMWILWPTAKGSWWSWNADPVSANQLLLT